eukprot:9501544-Pyramimonas_sp.AAC.1
MNKSGYEEERGGEGEEEGGGVQSIIIHCVELPVCASIRICASIRVELPICLGARAFEYKGASVVTV